MFSPVVSLRTFQIDVPEGNDVVFLSDVHLGYGTKQANKVREKRLITLLESLADTCCHLFIAGDLFDYWFDYSSVVPRDFVRCLSALHSLVDKGLPITYLMGNHDFGHATYFRDELNIEVDTGDVEAVIDGKRFYISHGDGKAHNDTGYLVLRSVLRNPVSQALYRMLHPTVGIGLASRTSHSSRDFTGEKDYGPHDGLRDFATKKIADGYDVVVMGHRHRASIERIAEGTYVNLGDWLSDIATYARYTKREGIKLEQIVGGT